MANPFAEYAPSADNNPFSEWKGDSAPDASEKGLSIEDVKHPLTYMGHEIGDAVESSWNKLKSDYTASTSIPKDWNKQSFWEQQKGQFRRMVASGMVPVDAFNLVTAPISGAVHGAVVKPAATTLSLLNPMKPDKASPNGVRKETQSDLERDVSGMMLGIAPELGPGKTISEVLAATKKPPVPKPKTPYNDAVKSLRAEGVDLTLGQIHGGKVRQLEEESKNNRFVAQAVREAEDKAVESFNKAAYNRALAPIGETYKGTAVGREGVKAVGGTLSEKYDSLMPHLKMTPDDTFLNTIFSIRKEASALPGEQEKQLENILNDRVLSRIDLHGALNGADFKQVESELSHLSRTYKSSADAGHRELGDAIEDISTALRENLERTSAPEVRQELAKLNTAYSVLVRLENASARSAVKGGVFSTEDLLGAIKAGDKSTRRRSFARGDALLQDFAEKAHTVLKSSNLAKGERVLKVGPGVLGAGLGGAVGGVPGAALGGLADLVLPTFTNPAATKAMEVVKRRTP